MEEKGHVCIPLSERQPEVVPDGTTPTPALPAPFSLAVPSPWPSLACGDDAGMMHARSRESFVRGARSPLPTPHARLGPRLPACARHPLLARMLPR